MAKKEHHITAINLMRTTLPGWDMPNIRAAQAGLRRMKLVDLLKLRHEIKAECDARAAARAQAEAEA